MIINDHDTAYDAGCYDRKDLDDEPNWLAWCVGVWFCTGVVLGLTIALVVGAI